MENAKCDVTLSGITSDLIESATVFRNSIRGEGGQTTVEVVQWSEFEEFEESLRKATTFMIAQGDRKRSFVSSKVVGCLKGLRNLLDLIIQGTSGTCSENGPIPDVVPWDSYTNLRSLFEQIDCYLNEDDPVEAVATTLLLSLYDEIQEMQKASKGTFAPQNPEHTFTPWERYGNLHSFLREARILLLGKGERKPLEEDPEDVKNSKDATKSNYLLATLSEEIKRIKEQFDSPTPRGQGITKGRRCFSRLSNVLRNIDAFFSNEEKLKEENPEDPFVVALNDIVQGECFSLIKRKSHDYGGEKSLEERVYNLLDFGWPGVVIRLGDKYHRLRAFLKQGECRVADETIDDTLRDMANYALIALFMRRKKLGDVRPFIKPPSPPEWWQGMEAKEKTAPADGPVTFTTYDQSENAAPVMKEAEAAIEKIEFPQKDVGKNWNHPC